MVDDAGSNFSGHKPRLISPKLTSGASMGTTAALTPPPLTARPAPRRVPFAAAAGQFVASGIHRPGLALVLELRIRDGEGERKVDGLLVVHRLLSSRG
jgi:hypothetical protein